MQWVDKEQAGLLTLEHYLDGFIFAGRKQEDYKIQGSVTFRVFLGIEITKTNTNQRCFRIPTSKIIE